MPTALVTPSLHQLGECPKAWRLLHLVVATRYRDRIVSEDGRRLVRAIDRAGAPWGALVVNVRIALLRDGMEPDQIDDFIFDTVCEERFIFWRR
jgi:hypothetical protein